MPSLVHQVLTRVIPVLRGRSEVRDPERVRADVLAAQAGADESPPRGVARRFEVTRRDSHGMPVLELRPRGTAPTRTVLYVHGGGFVSGLDRFHWRYAARLAARLGVRVALPAYPLTPTHTWHEVAPALRGVLAEAADSAPGGVVVMGDSAGGGLALGLAQESPRLVSHLVLLAPWVELTDATPGTVEAAREDPWLTLSTLSLYGRWWGRDDPAASQLRHSVAGLPPTLLFCGTRDLLVPQSRALARRAREAGVDLTYVEQAGLIHVYPLLPIPEAGPAFEQVVAFLGS